MFEMFPNEASARQWFEDIRCPEALRYADLIAASDAPIPQVGSEVY